MITEHQVMSSSFGSCVESHQLIARSPDLLLSLFLLHEYVSGQSSEWAPYIDILPLSFSTPFHLDVDAFRALKGTAAFGECLVVMKTLLLQYHYVLQQLQQSAWGSLTEVEFSFSRFLWANSVVMTRRNEIVVDGLAVAALIPGWDICNHSFGPVDSHYDAAASRIEFRPSTGFANGQQVFMSYGMRCNGELYLFSGFTDSQHPDDYLKVEIQFNDKDPLIDRRLEVGAEMGFRNKNRIPLYASAEYASNSKCFSVLQVLLAPKDELSKPDFLIKVQSGWFSEETRSAALKWLRVKLMVLGRLIPERISSSTENDASRAANNYCSNEKALVERCMAIIFKN
eukprot:Partr_v1_DN25901_c0_g1_i2_m68637 putative SET domain containing